MHIPSIEEIKRRKLVQWGAAYLGGAWVLLQVVDILGATYSWPSGLLRAIPVLLAVGFLAAVVLAWYHGEQGTQRVSGIELSILAVLLGFAGLGVALVGRDEGTGSSEQTATLDLQSSLGSDRDQTALAVLPFESIGGDGVFAAGLTDELHQTLSRVPALRVTAQTSATSLKAADLTADSIGQALGVAHLLEGSVRAIGDRVRVAARLVDTRSGLQTWSDTYDHEIADVFLVQEEIARAVGVELSIELGSAIQARTGVSDPEAFALVVRARQLLERGVDDYSVTLPEAQRLYEAAISLDSAYAHAWAGLANVRVMLTIGDYVPDPQAEVARATADAERALSLNPNDWLAHQVLAGRASGRGDYASARLHYEQAIAANPADAASLARMAIVMLTLGDEAAALRSAQQAAELDPLNDNALYSAAYTHSATGRHRQAIQLGRSMLALVPSDLGKVAGLANFLAAAGDADEAIALAERVVEAGPQWQHGLHVLAFAHAQAGNREEAELVLDATTNEVYSIRAAVEAALGDFDAAFAALESSLVNKEPTSRQFHTDNWLRVLHGDPRWEPLISLAAESWRDP